MKILVNLRKNIGSIQFKGGLVIANHCNIETGNAINCPIIHCVIKHEIMVIKFVHLLISLKCLFQCKVCAQLPDCSINESNIEMFTIGLVPNEVQSAYCLFVS